MNIAFLSRKKPEDIGGLSRFVSELTLGFDSPLILSLGSFQVFRQSVKKRVDLLHLTDATLLPIGITIGHIMKIPVTITAHGLDLTYKFPIYQKMLKLLLPGIFSIVLDSHSAYGLLVPFGIAKEKICIIPPGISIRYFRNKTPLSLPPIPEGAIVLLTVGNLVKRKGHEWFIKEVFASLPNEFIYLIVGDGPRKKYISNLVLKLGFAKRIHLVGQILDTELAKLYSHSHIYVCANQHIADDFEGFGLAVGEASAMGLPVVASKVDGIVDLIHHKKNGWLVQPEPEAFITALMKLRNNVARARLGKRSQQFMRTHFHWKETINQYASFFKGVIDKTQLSH